MTQSHLMERFNIIVLVTIAIEIPAEMKRLGNVCVSVKICNALKVVEV